MKAEWKLDHIGIAVRDIGQAKRFYLDQAGYQEELAEKSGEHLVDILFLKGPEPLIELISPLPGNTILERFLERRGEGLHHLCYKVGSVTEELVKLREDGIQLIDETPRPGSRGMKVAFLHPKSSGSGVLIELCSPI